MRRPRAWRDGASTAATRDVTGNRAAIADRFRAAAVLASRLAAVLASRLASVRAAGLAVALAPPPAALHAQAITDSARRDAAAAIGARVITRPTDAALLRLDHAVSTARDAAARARVRDTADGDARLRHPVRIAPWLAEWRRTPEGALRQALAAAVLQHADTVQLDSLTARALGASLDPASDAWALP
ncbi:MAG: hypothetical protein HY275_08430 [Gemmatimonadetes bacterium]|nr:hypothetical protein [Gemmatimonadota bacterium]